MPELSLQTTKDENGFSLVSAEWIQLAYRWQRKQVPEENIYIARQEKHGWKPVWSESASQSL